MIVILRLAAGILLAGIVFWAISNAFNWMRGSINGYKTKRNRPKPTEEEVQERHINNRKKVRKLVILYLCLCAALVIIIVSADAYF
jgi:GH35 family endo-1,4-beta-xylanase